MIYLYSCKSDQLTHQEVEHCFKNMPDFIKTGVRNNENFADKKNKIIARRMILDCLRADGVNYNSLFWDLGKNLKPYIQGWRKFNISHSGDIAIVGLSESNIGVDIEKHTGVDYLSIMSYFHLDEQKFILKAASRENAFYKIWVKKEAFLKAIGHGITNGLDWFNSTNNFLIYNEKKWFFNEVDINKGYTCYICYESDHECDIHVKFITNIVNNTF